MTGSREHGFPKCLCSVRGWAWVLEGAEDKTDVEARVRAQLVYLRGREKGI